MTIGDITIILLLFVAAVIFAAIVAHNVQSRRRTVSDDSFSKGLIALIENDFATAIKLLRNAAMQDTQNIFAFLLLGDIMRKQDNVERALQIHSSLLSRAFATPQQKARVLKSLALDVSKQKKYEKAIEYIKEAISIYPDRWSYEFLLDMLEHLGNWEEAFQILVNIGGEPETLARYKVELGKKAAQTDGHRARILFKEALKFDPNCVEAMVLIGDAYIKDGRTKDAIEWWVKVIETFPQKANLVVEKLEEAYYEIGEFDKAMEIYRKVLAEHPDAEIVRLALASIYEKMGELDRAKMLIQQAPNKTVPIIIAEARIHCIQGNIAAAKNAIESIIDIMGMESRNVRKTS